MCIRDRRYWKAAQPQKPCLLLLPTAYFPFIARPHHRLNVSPDMKVAFNLNLQRITRGNEVLEDDVGYMLVEDFDVSERVDVELQTLQLNAALVGNVLEANCGEVGEVGKGACLLYTSPSPR